MIDYIGTLLPGIQERFRALLAAWDGQSIKYVQLGGSRTLAVQQALFAQGRLPLAEVNRLRVLAGLWPLTDKDNVYRVTNCDGIRYKSNHQGGRALDCAPLDHTGEYPVFDAVKYQLEYKTMGRIATSLGIGWGGLWRPLNPASGIGWDPPHWQIEEGT